MGDITRREFIGIIKAATVIGSIGALAATLLSRRPTVSVPGYDSIDTLTKKMLEDLDKATRDNLEAPPKVETYDDTSSKVTASIIMDDNLNKRYSIEHSFNGDAYYKAIETLKIGSSTRTWFYNTEEPLRGVTCFTSYDNKNKRKKFNPENANPVFRRIRDLLNIDAIRQNSQGEDLTCLVYALSKNVLSINANEFKITHNYWDQYDIHALFKEGDFEIQYKFWDTAEATRFTISDGKNRLCFDGNTYNKGGRAFINLSVNSSDFKVVLGKLDGYPRRVYNEASAWDIINKAREMEKYLTSNIKNTPIENYTKLFERLISTKIDESATIEKRFEDLFNKPCLIAEISSRKLDINYDTWSNLDANNIHIHSGDDYLYIGVSKIQKKVRHVVFNGHPFALKRGVDFIKHTYTPQQANYIITEAQKVADGIIKMVYDDKFPKGYIGQSLIRNV